MLTPDQVFWACVLFVCVVLLTMLSTVGEPPHL
jgi:hypothetical protein